MWLECNSAYILIFLNSVEILVKKIFSYERLLVRRFLMLHLISSFSRYSEIHNMGLCASSASAERGRVLHVRVLELNSDKKRV